MSRRRLTLDSPTGAVTITEEDGAIVGVTWGGTTVTSGGNEDGGLLQDAAQQLRDYFAGARHAFDLPLKPRGSEFHRAVWREMLAIPYGRSEEHTSELQSLMRISYAVFCLKQKKTKNTPDNTQHKQQT